MSTQSVQQYIKAQADFYYSQGCVNQKQEVVASPSYMPFYKNKTEEQILYEHLKEKRGPSKKYDDTLLTPSSILEKERTELLNKGQSDRSFNSIDEPSGYPREQKIIQPRDIRQPIVNIETKPSDTFSSSRRDKEEYEDRNNLLNSRPIEKIEVEASPIIKQESELVISEDNKQKKGPSLRDKLLAKKKEMETSKVVEKPKVEPSSGSIPKENPSFSSRQGSGKVEIHEEDQGSKEIPSGNKQFATMENRRDPTEFSLKKQEMQRKEEIQNKMDISNMTMNTEIGDLAEGDYARPNYIEEPKSLINRASDLSKQNRLEKNAASDREQEEQRQDQKNQGYGAQNYRDEEHKEERYDKPRQEGRRNLMEDDEESESKFENRSQRGNTSKQKEEDNLSQGGISDTNPHQQRTSPLIQESQRKIEEDYMIKSGVTDKQSQASKSSGQRNREEQEFDESEREPSTSYQHGQLRKSKGIEVKPKEVEREYEYQKRDYLNAEDTKMATSYYINQKEVQGYHGGYRPMQQETVFDRPPKSETSIVESNEKKVEKNEKAGSRPVVSYLKSIEEMLMRIMAKQDLLEENQKKMMQIQKRQDEQIEAIRLQLEGEE